QRQSRNRCQCLADSRAIVRRSLEYDDGSARSREGDRRGGRRCAATHDGDIPSTSHARALPRIRPLDVSFVFDETLFRAFFFLQIKSNVSPGAAIRITIQRFGNPEQGLGPGAKNLLGSWRRPPAAATIPEVGLPRYGHVRRQPACSQSPGNAENAGPAIG